MSGGMKTCSRRWGSSEARVVKERWSWSDQRDEEIVQVSCIMYSGSVT